jgi:ketosteroid isomerase-like protein
MTVAFKTCVLLLFVFACFGCAQLTKPKFDEKVEADAIRSVLNGQQIAWNNGDMDAFMQGYWNSDSLQFLSQRGINRGWKEALAGYKKGYPNREAMGTLSFELIQIKSLSPENFVVTGKFHLTRSNGNMDGSFTLIFQKIDGKWVAVYDHTC